MENASSAPINQAKLFVGNLAYAVTEPELQDLFGQYGEIVSVTVITDRFSGRSKGMAFVEFASAEEAQAAINALHEQELSGRNMIVAVAQPKSDKPRQGGGGYRGGHGNGGGGYGQRGGGSRGGYGQRGSSRGGYDRDGGYGGGNSNRY